MSTYLMLVKAPESPDERKQLIAKHFENETYLDSLQLTYIQKTLIKFLLCNKGFQPQNFEINKAFNIKLNDIEFVILADLILKINEKNFAFIKCAVNSLDSWERYTIAFCRAADSYQIPFALLTDGKNIRLIDSISGRVLAGDILSIPSLKEWEYMLQDITFQQYPENKKEMEKRIIYAFEGIKCPNLTSEDF